MNQPQPQLHEAPPPKEPPAGTYERCHECGAPLDRKQRYCVSCGARRGDAANPASRYFTSASMRRRLATPRSSPPATGSGGRAAAVAFFALLPVAVAIGVLVGRGGGSNDSLPPDLLNALKNGGAATSAGSGSAQDVADTSSKLLPSDFSLDNGYTVKLDLLPVQGTDAAAADAAKKSAESKGAKQVGIINPGDFTTTPDQGQKDYVLYSGEYKQKADAQKALGGLKKKFPSAQVIQVRSSSAGSQAGDSSNAGAVSKQNVLAHTSHGDIHKVTGIKPTKQEIQKDTKTVQRIANDTGKSYVQRQRQLPDIIAVGGDSNSPPPLPTGNGD